jgi:hypothetical protein
MTKNLINLFREFYEGLEALQVVMIFAIAAAIFVATGTSAGLW